MGDIPKHVQARNVLRPQQVDRKRIGLLEECSQQVARIDFFLLCALAVRNGVLENPVESERLLRVVGFVAGNRLEILGKKPVERGLEGGKLSARMPENLLTARIVKQRVEQMLNSQRAAASQTRDKQPGASTGVLCRSHSCTTDHSFSIPARRGKPWRSATRCTAASLVSATSST